MLPQVWFRVSLFFVPIYILYSSLSDKLSPYIAAMVLAHVPHASILANAAVPTANAKINAVSPVTRVRRS